MKYCYKEELQANNKSGKKSEPQHSQKKKENYGLQYYYGFSLCLLWLLSQLSRVTN